ncbi:MAG TPA: RNA polymerase sigma factor [Bryobacteraceae bacterium]|jgi:RNA polymerase sigma-70 factor (ECF subfamily)
MGEIRSVVESVFREESGRIIAGLIRISGSFDRAEEAMQEAFVSALASWPVTGLPRNPAAWIMTAAHRKLIDTARKERTRQQKQDSLVHEIESVRLPESEQSEEDPMNFPDDRLRLIFTCCHPAINLEAQVALTLRTLGGLTTTEIAKAFLLPEATLAQRLVRAKRKIQEARIPYEVPPRERLAERLGAVQTVIYLIFNEGYSASSGTGLIRGDLCGEAIRLGRLLCDLLPRDGGNLGLLALMLLHHSRREARVVDGQLVTLEEQDRTLWDRDFIAEGLILVDNALSLAPVGTYQLQAAIAALHARVAAPDQTDWAQIAALYQRLSQISPSPVIQLNKAVAIAMSGRVEEGLQRIEELGSDGTLDQYYLFHAARADLLRRLNRADDAANAYRKAAALATNPVELDFLHRRLQQLPTAR